MFTPGRRSLCCHLRRRAQLGLVSDHNPRTSEQATMYYNTVLIIVTFNLKTTTAGVSDGFRFSVGVG
jgi:hypothetical protein